MIKKLQNYNRQILAAVSVLLLIVFLAPTAVTQCSQGGGSSDTAWARTSDGTTLTLGDLQDMRAQLAVLEVMGGPVVGRLGASKSPEHWWLLVKEARDAGLVGGEGDGRTMLEESAARSGARPDDVLMQLASSARQQPQVVLDTLANLRGVERLVGLSVGNRRLSDARMRDAAREMLTNASCDVVVLDGAVATKALPIDPPGEDRLAKLFEAGKDQPEGAGPGGIGYRHATSWPAWQATPRSDRSSCARSSGATRRRSASRTPSSPPARCRRRTRRTHRRSATQSNADS
jgi:hypothetical protein